MQEIINTFQAVNGKCDRCFTNLNCLTAVFLFTITATVKYSITSDFGIEKVAKDQVKVQNTCAK